jgi:hypothetical protein
LAIELESKTIKIGGEHDGSPPINEDKLRAGVIKKK